MSPSFDETIQADVFIVGSGPIGATFARKLVEAGRRVLMVEAGPQYSARPGEHLKNAAIYQHNIDLFAPIIRGHLHLLSVPSSNQPVVTLDPDAFQVDFAKYLGFVQNNQNPEQDHALNIPAAAATYGVGGMATHWTCAVPRHHPLVERMNVYGDQEWDDLYGQGEALLNMHRDEFAHSIRHNVVLDALGAEYTDLPEPYGVQNLPLAVERRTDDPRYVRWSGTDTVLGPLADGEHPDAFDLRSQHVCRRVHLSADGSRVEYAEVYDLTTSRSIRVEAGTTVLACNAILTPQLLHASHIRPEALGRYLTEQPVAFCQIVLRQDLVNGIRSDPRFTDRVRAYEEQHPEDPVPIPEEEPEPNVWIPVSQNRPWHCQIHRDAFAYGEVAANIDTRLVVDLRWFGITQPRPENRVRFSEVNVDIFGLPQPIFEYRLSDDDRRRSHMMMRDMLRAAGVLGGFLPQSEPQFVAPGLPLHFAGTVRMGTVAEESVVDPNSKVWGISNLYLGGNGLIATGNASNPTLTSVALAIRAADHIIRS
jgi:pyranose oxidase